MNNFERYLLAAEATLLDALAKLNTLSADLLTLLVVDAERRLLGTLTDGDIRRALIRGVKLEEAVTKAVHRDSFVLHTADYSLASLRTIRSKRLTLVPLIDGQGRVVRVFNFRDRQSMLPVDGVLMAGGRGERLRPLTDTVPKPLLLLGGKPIAEYNIDRMANYGIENITLSVRYLGEQLKEHFGDGKEKGITIRYVDEDRPLGTLGAVSRIHHFTHDAVLVMNSDLFTNIDLEEFYIHFRESGADMAVASIPYNVSVPYAVMQTSDGLIRSFEEKPTYTYYSNGGIYLIRRTVIESLLEDERLDATDLMERLITAGKRVSYFPLVGYWIDIGRPEDYRKAQEFVKYIKQ
ncbi:MAG: nucleotidyltransferase family protein [Bacteroides sp.]